MVLIWEIFLMVSGWYSEYRSVQNLLDYLRYRKSGSEASRRIYCRALYEFCQYAGKRPDELVAMNKKELESLIDSFGYMQRKKGRSSRPLNVFLCNIKVFFRVNGFKNERELDVELYPFSARSRTRPEYIPTLEEALLMVECAGTLRDKAIISLMVFSGLRNSTLRAIRFGDLRKELELGKEILLIRVHLDMKKLVNSACKGGIEYFTFVPKKTIDILRLYLAERLERTGNISDEHPLFPSEYNQLPRSFRQSRPLSDRQLQIIVKQAARRARINDWKAVTPHCLRKTFETLLRSRLRDGSRLDLQTQIFLMGHTLPGGLGPYFDARVEEMRKEYSKLIFIPSEAKLTKAIEVLKAASELLQSRGAQSDQVETSEYASFDPSETSKAIRDFVEEAQRNEHDHSKASEDQSFPSEHTGNPSKHAEEATIPTPIQIYYRFSQKLSRSSKVCG